MTVTNRELTEEDLEQMQEGFDQQKEKLIGITSKNYMRALIRDLRDDLDVYHQMCGEMSGNTGELLKKADQVCNIEL